MPEDIRKQLTEESVAMLRFALSRGLPTPQQAVEILATDHDAPAPITQLHRAHRSLAKAVAPAQPGSILMFARLEQSSGAGWLAIPRINPTVRFLLVALLCFLVGFTALSLSPDVNGKTSTSSILNSSGLPLLLNLLFYMCAAGLGSCFYSLFEVSQKIASRTYNTDNKHIYTARLALGIVAGSILTWMIPLLSAGDTGSTPEEAHSMFITSRPILALLGGFSSDLLYRLLNRLVKAVESVFQGDTESRIQAHQVAAQAQHEQQMMQERIGMGAKLLTLKRTLGIEPDTPQAEALDELLRKLVPDDLGLLTAASCATEE